MKKMSCIVIEDEPLSASVMEDHISQIPFLELKGAFRDAISAMHYLQSEPVDLLFLDIHLPKLKGLDFLRSFSFEGQVIITSAYHEYALEGYELNIVDYLLKPISFERFLKGVNKAKELYMYKNQYRSSETNISTNTDEEAIFFKSGTMIHKIDVNDITYLEKVGNYFNLHTKTGKKILIRINFADLTEKLPVKKFFRVHKSYVVSIRHIETIEGSHVLVNGEKIPISLSFKDEFMKIL